MNHELVLVAIDAILEKYEKSLTELRYVDQHRFQSIYDGHDDHGPNGWHNLGMPLC